MNTVPPTSPGEGYRFLYARPCRGRTCGALVYWWVTPRERRSPHDADGVSHFATCPDSERFRRPREEAPA